MDHSYHVVPLVIMTMLHMFTFIGCTGGSFCRHLCMPKLVDS